jgi:hypothetical protein
MSINDASALEDTLARLRQRYALHFYLSEDAQAKSQHNIRVDLSTEARIRYPEADVHSRRVFMGGGSTESGGPTVVTHQTAISDPIPGEGDAATSSSTKHKRVAVNEDSSGSAGSSVGPPSADDSAPAQTTPAQTAPAQSPNKGGWPKTDQTTGKP